MSPSHDVVLVGGGGAGLRAAIAIADSHPALNVAVVSKVYPMRSHTASAEGGAAGVIAPGDSFDEHAFDTIAGGDWMSDQDAVEVFVREAPEELPGVHPARAQLPLRGLVRRVPARAGAGRQSG